MVLTLDGQDGGLRPAGCEEVGGDADVPALVRLEGLRDDQSSALLHVHPAITTNKNPRINGKRTATVGTYTVMKGLLDIS